MKLMADEGVGASVVVRLLAEGHGVLYVAEMSPGMKNPEVLALAWEEEALLLATGVLLLHSEGLPLSESADGVAWALGEQGA